MAQPIIELQNVSRCFRRAGKPPFWALRDLNFSIPRGENVAIVGNNGSGKSTLLRLLARITLPTSGKITHHSDRITLMSLGAGFQEALSGRDNAIMSGLLLGLSFRQIQNKLNDIREFSELGEFFSMPVSTYSSGMRARLGFATACHIDAEILLIDEILAVGDQNFRDKAQRKIHSMLYQEDRTVILVSHNTQIVKNLCQFSLWLENGQLKAIGNTLEVLPQYEASSTAAENPA